MQFLSRSKKLVVVTLIFAAPIFLFSLLTPSQAGRSLEMSPSDVEQIGGLVFKRGDTIDLSACGQEDQFCVYLPSVKKEFPPLVHVPENQYLLVESWTHSVMDAHCPGLCVDFPAYWFDPSSGELVIFAPLDLSQVLNDDDIGYLGSGESLGGAGCGAASQLTRVERCPMSRGDVELLDVDETGAVTLRREGQLIVLKAGQAWVSDEVVETWEWLDAECVVTSTHRLTNFGFQERDKIVFLDF